MHNVLDSQDNDDEMDVFKDFFRDYGHDNSIYTFAR